MKKKLVKCISFSCLALIMIALTYKVLSWKDTSGAYVSVSEQLYNTEKNMMDVVFVGSSHVYTSIYPAYLWKSYGIAAFDMSLSEQDKYCSYYCLKELLKTQRPQVVCVEMYGLTLDGHEDIGNEYRNLLALKTSLNSIDLVKNGYTSQNTLDYILRWPIVHTRYRELEKYDFVANPVNEYSRGAVMGWGQRMAGYMNTDTVNLKDEMPISEENKQWLDGFIDLSEEYGFDLVLFLAPDFQSNEQKMISNGARSYAASKGIDYLDFTELAREMDFNPSTDMGDLLHCNADGALKVSTYFGEYLKEKYSLEDHRDDSRYHQWDEDYQLYRQIVQENNLFNAADDMDYLDILADSSNLTVILSLDGDYTGCTDLLEGFGISYEEAVTGGKWVYKNGSAEKIMDNNPGESHIYDFNRYDSIKIQCVPEGADEKSNLLFGLDQKIKVTSGLNVFVYDDIRNKEISNVGIYCY